MEEEKIVSVVFDYTSFLGAACRKKWTFLEAFASIAPVFGISWKNRLKQDQSAEERLWDQAFNTLSAQSSDEQNIILLTQLAKDEGIAELKLMMPYGLEPLQLENITKTSDVEMWQSDQDEFTIRL